MAQRAIKKDTKKFYFERHFTKEGVHPYDEIEWTKFTASIKNADGKEIFKQEGVQAPSFWSQTAINVVASKYFHGAVGKPDREYSIKQLIDRVAKTIAKWGLKDKVFLNEKEALIFEEELTYILVNQYASFNSPVWFNCGIEEKPQCSACFINSVEDTMESILELAKIEGLLFKYGSGTGTNFSTLRSSKESLSTGGTASGPVSFMRGYDAFAGIIKSGGKTRRAAKMVILNVDHPDIMEFIESKIKEEEKAKALIEAGYDGSIYGEAYRSVFFQNANHSVRVSDAFMEAVEKDLEWHTKAVTTGKIVDTYKAREILKRISYGTWFCGDPGLQFDDTINRWHTCKNSGRINASNPCSEYMFLDNSSCNLASLNLLKFLREDNTFDLESFKKAVRLLITAQEIIVDNSSYPRKEITENSHLFRPLGLGYANLGALLMALGLPYDSEKGRAYAATLTAIMTGEAYLQSSRIAQRVGPFERFEENRVPMLEVMAMHRDALRGIKEEEVPGELFLEAKAIWDEVLQKGEKYGFRNAQATVLAPTGTIGFMMDCDTTGIEPDLALIKIKSMVDGGTIRIVNRTVPRALKSLGYREEEIEKIVNFINENGTIEGAPFIKEKDLPVFDCAIKPPRGNRFINYMGHIYMMAAVQPFISGAISKTVNVPEFITVEEIMDIYIKAWKLGLKAIAIYRDNSKAHQPLSAGKKEKKSAPVLAIPQRKKLPDERRAFTHKFEVGGHQGYITVGMYEDNKPGEIFLTIAKEGSTISGLMDAFATAISIGLQYGVPLETFVEKFAFMRFEPQGMTKNPRIRFANSLVDYIFRYLASKFLPEEEQERYGIKPEKQDKQLELFKNSNDKNIIAQDGPPCMNCGAIMERSGSCFRCPSCGSTSGCS
ncbi:MAG: vitamin B12-dependent ribonucleotide reductase [Thermoanaerobaculia bacterium]